MKVAIAGGTGWIGKLVVERARSAGYDVSVLARATGANLVTGEGLEEAMRDVDAVIDVSNVVTTRKRRSLAFFEASTQNLLHTGMRVGVQHHVALSIVGSDRIDFGYYLGKRRQEALVLAGDVPATVLRTTQFHESADQMLSLSRGPMVLVPQMLSRPVAAREVANALVRIAQGPPLGLAPEMAGPQTHRMPDMVRRLIQVRGLHRWVWPVRLPGRVGNAFASGGLLPQGNAEHGQETFERWLDSQRDLTGAIQAIADDRPSDHGGQS